MFYSLLKNSFSSIAITLLFLSNTIASEENHINILDRMTYTINPKFKLIGPVFRDQADKNERTQYVSSLLNLIIKNADLKARKYLEAGDTQAYYAFLTLALTVPLHEGLYIHFRNVSGNFCNINANNGELVKQTGVFNYNVFKKYFKSSVGSYFPNCEEMPSTNEINQIVRGSDGSDLSIMQISIRWHFDDFLLNKKYESVARTLNYGDGLLLDGFDPVYRNIADYNCLLKPVSFYNKKIDYINLIRGIWAGKYNSGSIKETCRFANQNSPYRTHDIVFSQNLNLILSFNGTISPSYIGEFTVETDTSNAIKEIVSNLKENKNNHTALFKILDL
jgi:hypothetical protein